MTLFRNRQDLKERSVISSFFPSAILFPLAFAFLSINYSMSLYCSSLLLYSLPPFFSLSLPSQ